MHQMGYTRDHVLVIGDAVGDLKGAENNGVHFYPVLAGAEQSKWDDFANVALNIFHFEAYSAYESEQ